MIGKSVYIYLILIEHAGYSKADTINYLNY